MTPRPQYTENAADNKNYELPLRLFVHTPKDDIVSFPQIRTDATIGELKSQLELKTGILAELQSLYMNNTRLEDTKTLRDKRVKNGTVLRIKIKERSLQQIYLAASVGKISDVFMLGVEYIEDDDNQQQTSGDDDYYERSRNQNNNPNNTIIDQVKAWNTFVPLRAFQALFAACFAGHLPVVSRLLDNAAANISMVTKNRHSLLHVAAFNGHLSVVSFLLSKGANSKLLDLEGLSALSLAALNGHVKVEKHLWLFNWNMEVITGLDNPKTISEEEREVLEMRETALKYRNQYKRVAKKNKHELSLPAILTDQLNVMKTNCENQNIKLPDIENQEQETKGYSKKKSNSNKFERNTELQNRAADGRKNRQILKNTNISTSKSEYHIKNEKSRALPSTESTSKNPLLVTTTSETVKGNSNPIWSNGIPQLTKYQRSANKPLINIDSTIELKPTNQPQISFKNYKVKATDRPIKLTGTSFTQTVIIAPQSKSTLDSSEGTTTSTTNVNTGNSDLIEQNHSYLPFHTGEQQVEKKKKKTLFVSFNDGTAISGAAPGKSEDDLRAQPPRLAKVTVDSMDLQEGARFKHIISTDREQVKRLLKDDHPKRMISTRDTFWREPNTNNNHRLKASLNHPYGGNGSKEIPMNSNIGTNAAYVVTVPSNPQSIAISTTDVVSSVVAPIQTTENTSVDEVTSENIQSINTPEPLILEMSNTAVDKVSSLSSKAITSSDKTMSVKPSELSVQNTDNDEETTAAEQSFTNSALPDAVQISRRSDNSLISGTPVCQKSSIFYTAVPSIADDSATAASQTTSLVIESSKHLNKGAEENHLKKHFTSKITKQITDTNAVYLGEDHKNQGVGLFTVEDHQASKYPSWQPSVSLQTESVRVNGRFVKTYDEWLEEKKRSKDKKKVEATPSSKKVEEVTDEAHDTERQILHEQWLAAKEKEFKKQKLRTRSEERSFQTLRRMRTFSSHACTFEQWLEKKREEVPQRSITPTPSVDKHNDPNKKHTRRERIKHGMTFIEWKDWKERQRERKLREVALKYENNYQELEKKRRKELNNKTYEQWLHRKNEERKIDIALEETLKAQRMHGERIRKQQKLHDPHLKTFDEWLLEKDYDRKYEVARQNGNSYEHHPEDSAIIFDMWLANKFANEMSAERTKLNKVKYGDGFGSMMSIGENESSDDSNTDYENDFESD